MLSGESISKVGVLGVRVGEGVGVGGLSGIRATARGAVSTPRVRLMAYEKRHKPKNIPTLKKDIRITSSVSRNKRLWLLWAG